MEQLPATAKINDAEQREKLHQLLGQILINITNQVFKDRTLYIDGYRFINCSFINCLLICNRGTFEFHNCYENNTKHSFDFESLKTIKFYSLHRPEFSYSDAFKATQHADGSFSIGQGV